MRKIDLLAAAFARALPDGFQRAPRSAEQSKTGERRATAQRRATSGDTPRRQEIVSEVSLQARPIRRLSAEWKRARTASRAW